MPNSGFMRQLRLYEKDLSKNVENVSTNLKPIPKSWSTAIQDNSLKSS